MKTEEEVNTIDEKFAGRIQIVGAANSVRRGDAFGRS